MSVIATEDGAVLPFPSTLTGALGVCGGLMVGYREITAVAEALAECDDLTWATLEWSTRADYERRAKAAIRALGIDIDNGRGL